MDIRGSSESLPARRAYGLVEARAALTRREVSAARSPEEEDFEAFWKTRAGGLRGRAHGHFLGDFRLRREPLRHRDRAPANITGITGINSTR